MKTENKNYGERLANMIGMAAHVGHGSAHTTVDSSYDPESETLNVNVTVCPKNPPQFIPVTISGDKHE